MVTSASPSMAAVSDVERRRERAVLALGARGDAAGVLRLCAAWAALGTPTVAAKVGEGRALLQLRLVDKALARAREAVETAPSDKAALRLLAEVYVERGWPSRARPVLSGLRTAGEDVDELWARAAAEPATPEATAREVEASGDPARILKLAEQFLGSGSLTRAAQLLEKLAATRPNDPRIRELRWALAGDFSSPEPVELLVKRALPAILELSAVPEESEHTESLGDNDASLLLEPETGAAPFPTLFKRAGPVAEPVPPGAAAAPSGETEEEERTASSAIPEPGAAPLALQNVSGGTEGDTQIRMIVGEGEPAGPMHRKREEGGRSLNLREWQASMGVDPLASDLDDVENSEVMRLSAGDSLIEPAPPAPPPPREPIHAFDAPIEVIEKHPVPQAEPVSDDALIDDDPPTRSGSPVLRLALAGLFLVGFVVVLALLGLLIARASGLLDAARAGVDLSRVLASSDYPALVEAEVRLSEHADQPAEAAELARARLVLWAEYDGDHALLEQVDAYLANPVGIDAHRLAYLRAAELLAFRNPASALAAIGRESAGDDEERLLLARIHAALGDGDAALADLEELSTPDEPRFRLGRAQVLLAAGRAAEARAIVTLLVSTSPNLVAARLLELQLREGTPKERAAAAGVFRRTYSSLGLSPRQEGEASWVEAKAWMEAEDREHAVRAAEIGVARDGTHRDLLMLLAHEDVESGDLVDAARKLASLVELYRADLEARRDLVIVYLELDRIDEAKAVAQAANPPLQGVLSALVYGWSGEAGAPDPATVDPSTPIGAWAQALLAVSAHRADAASIVASAATTLAAAEEPIIRRFARRAEVLAATLLPEAEAAAKVGALRQSGIADAVAHVYFGRYYERAGQRILAAQHFDRAADLEPELGVALYEKGRFYADAGDDKVRTDAAWQAYLALAPSGPRAERAKGVATPVPG